jgi:hypothetical protein
MEIIILLEENKNETSTFAHISSLLSIIQQRSLFDVPQIGGVMYSFEPRQEEIRDPEDSQHGSQDTMGETGQGDQGGRREALQR